MDKNLNTGSRKHDVSLPHVPTTYLIQQRAGLERLHQFDNQCSKLDTNRESGVNLFFSAVRIRDFAAPGAPVHKPCVTVTRLATTLLFILAALALFAQAQPPAARPNRVPGPRPAPDLSEYRVYSDPPRLLLNARRLRLLRRERERQSMRWQQFAALIEGHARMPEPGLSGALYGVVADSKSGCDSALEWSLGPADPQSPNDLRQMALTADWCSALAGPDRLTRLRNRLLPALKTRPRDVIALRSAAFAAIAVADAAPKESAGLLQYAVDEWWRQQIAPRLRAGEDPFPSRAALLALTEFTTVVRDVLRIDPREDAVHWFNELAPRMMLSYYPIPRHEAENEYRIAAYHGSGDPDLTESVNARAAEFMLVAADPNGQPTQFLQGWLMQDRFLMRSPLGAPYELLWANPYLPGLSFSYMPDLYHGHGRLFARSSWEEDATWFGLWDGEAQIYRDGQRTSIQTWTERPPLDLGPVRIFFGGAPAEFDTAWFKPQDDETKPVEQVAFVSGLDAGAAYDVRLNEGKPKLFNADSSGVLELRFEPGMKCHVRVRKHGAAAR